MKKMFIIISLLTTQVSFAEIASASIDPVRQNELIYLIKQDCGSCHGMTLKGGLGPALLPEALTGKSQNYLVTTIMEGRENTAMPPWKSMLNQNEAIWIAKQLQNGLTQETTMIRFDKTRDNP